VAAAAWQQRGRGSELGGIAAAAAAATARRRRLCILLRPMPCNNVVDVGHLIDEGGERG
jgi:hypothetical protein